MPRLPKDLALIVWKFLVHTPETVFNLLEDHAEMLTEQGVAGGLEAHTLSYIYGDYEFICRSDCWKIREQLEEFRHELCKYTRLRLIGQLAQLNAETWFVPASRAFWFGPFKKQFFAELYSKNPDFPREEPEHPFLPQSTKTLVLYLLTRPTFEQLHPHILRGALTELERLRDALDD